MKKSIRFQLTVNPKLLLILTGAVVAWGIAFPAAAQLTRGSISGLVVDTSGAVVPNARITVTETETGVRTSAVSGANGLFLIAAVLPGSYKLAVEARGFKALEKANLHVSAGQRLDVGTLQLQLGSVTQTVTVQSQGPPVELDSGDQGALVSGKDVNNLPMAGRNWASLLNLLPGAITPTNSLEPDTGNANIPFYNGVSPGFSGVFEDGVNNRLPRNPVQYGAGETPDAIAELKVETSNYNAEYGGAGGANVQLISRSGTSQFHGDIFGYIRNEAWEANDFFNNMTGAPKLIDRFQDYGGTVGGPIYWPGRFNSEKNKLFFFVSEEYVPVNGPSGGLSTLTMPTAAQRNGDFSQTNSVGGALIPILNPFNNHQPFPGNIIPQNLINPGGRALLNLFPLPNFNFPSISLNNYNYVYQPYLGSYNYYNFNRIDYDPTEKLRLFWRLDYDPVCDTGLFGANWPELITRDCFPYTVTAVDASYTISPTMVNEVNIGLWKRDETNTPLARQLSALNRQTAGVSIPQFHPQYNPNHIVPQALFGGGEIPNPPAIQFNGVFPDTAFSPMVTGSDSLTMVRGAHTIKGGIYFTWSRWFTDSGSYPFDGAFDFSTNATNPYDANYPFANALLGTYYSYSESSSKPVQDVRGLDLEWYAQDTWKATRRLTLNYGLRFYYFTPWHQANGLGLNFIPSDYNASQAVKLYMPVLNSQGERVAQNPLTGQLFPPDFIGAIVPGSGYMENGLVSAKASGVPTGFMYGRGVQYAPRFGFAYALTGDEKTVLRGGFGISYEGHDDQSLIVGTVLNTDNTASAYDGTFATLTSAPTVVFPTSINAINPHTKTPTVFSESLGIQREIGFGTRLGVTYVGTFGRHLDLPQTYYDAVPPGSEFLPQHQDPTEPGSPLPDNFFRPYMGYSAIALQQFVNSNYNSLQIEGVHRFTKDLEFNANYTWSKTMGYYPPFATYYNNLLQYGAVSFDRTNVFRLSYVYNLPKVSSHWNSGPARWFLDNWQLAGIVQFESGFPQSLTCNFTYPVNLFGGGDYGWLVNGPAAGRCNLTGPLELPKSKRTFYHFFNPNVVAPPTTTHPGDAAPDAFRGPGVNDWDLTLFKNIPLGESRSLQLRVETFNTWNHPQFNTVNSTATFDQTGQQVNSGLGEITADYLPRQIQFALKFIF